MTNTALMPTTLRPTVGNQIIQKKFMVPTSQNSRVLVATVVAARGIDLIVDGRNRSKGQRRADLTSVDFDLQRCNRLLALHFGDGVLRYGEVAERSAVDRAHEVGPALGVALKAVRARPTGHATVDVHLAAVAHAEDRGIDVRDLPPIPDVAVDERARVLLRLRRVIGAGRIAGQATVHSEAGIDR